MSTRITSTETPAAAATLSDLFATAAVAYSQPTTGKGNPVGERMNAARGAFAEGEIEIRAAWQLVEAAEQIRATNPAMANVDPASIVLMLAADALIHLGASLALPSKTVVIGVEGDHTPANVLGWLDASGYEQYAADLNGDGTTDETPCAVHIECDYDAGCARVIVTELAAAAE